MKILGIETSCDETSASVVEDGRKVLSNVIYSQVATHNATGGVVPEVAAREHVLKIMPVIDEAIKKSGFSLDEIDAIAVTHGPGLMSSLIIGVIAAQTLAVASKKILIPVNHISGHIYANWLDENPTDPVQFPAMVLTVSGGHNELVYMKEHVNFKQIGETLDDAAGEAFDKVARMLGLGYPGGPLISKAALNGDRKAFEMPNLYMGRDNYDFSFSGLKTAVLNMVRKEFEANGKLSEKFIADMAASFEDCVCGILSDKLLRAAQELGAKEVHLAGGVSANRWLRALTQQKIDEGYYGDHLQRKVKLNIKPKLRFASNIAYCTDNAAMIAGTAYFHYKKWPEKYKKMAEFTADPNLKLYGN